MAAQLGLSQPRHSLMDHSSSSLGVSRRLFLQRNFNSNFVSMKTFTSGSLFSTLRTSSVPTPKPVVGLARRGCCARMKLNMNDAEFNERVYQVVAEFNIGASSPSVPILTSPSQSSPQPTAVINIAHLVLEYLKVHDEEIMMKLKTWSEVPPRVTEYMECYALLLDKFKVLERGNKFLVSFAVFDYVLKFIGSLLSYIFDHIYYGMKWTERMTKKSDCAVAVGCCDKDDLKPPFLFMVAEFLESIVKEIKCMMKASDGDEE